MRKVLQQINKGCTSKGIIIIEEVDIRMLEPTQQQRDRNKWLAINKIFFVLDASFAALALIISFFFIPDDCSMSFFLYYTIYFIGQSIQHFLILKMPLLDVVKHDKVIRRYLVIVSAIQISYFFLAFMFWVKTEIHPMYCFFCGKLGLSPIIGVLLILHFVASLLTYIQFLYGYINRKYYLLALGGFEVEQRIIEQREQNLRRVALIEPFYNEYPVIQEEQQANPNSKYYKFQDVAEDAEGEKVCSICLARSREGLHPILTACKHYFHRECIQKWARLNGKCPQCRSPFEERQLSTIEEDDESEH